MVSFTTSSASSNALFRWLIRDALDLGGYCDYRSGIDSAVVICAFIAWNTNGH